MSIQWKNRLLFWVLATVPFGLVVLGSDILGPFWFTGFLLIYIFIYRPALETQRLLGLNVIEEKDAWRFFIPFAVDRIRYTKALWWG